MADLSVVVAKSIGLSQTGIKGSEVNHGQKLFNLMLSGRLDGREMGVMPVQAQLESE